MMRTLLHVFGLAATVGHAQPIISPLRMVPPNGIYAEGRLLTNSLGFYNGLNFTHCCPPYGVEFDFNSQTGRTYIVETAISASNTWLEYSPSNGLIGIYTFKPVLQPNLTYVNTNRVLWKMAGQPMAGTGGNINVRLNSLSDEAYFRVRQL